MCPVTSTSIMVMPFMTLHDLMLYVQVNLAEKNSALTLTHQVSWGQADGFGAGMA